MIAALKRRFCPPPAPLLDEVQQQMLDALKEAHKWMSGQLGFYAGFARQKMIQRLEQIEATIKAAEGKQ